MIILCIVVLISISSVCASTKCISQSAIKKYEELRGPLQDIKKFLDKCHGSYTSKEPITTLRQSIKKIEKEFAAVNKIFYKRKWSDEQQHNGHCYIFSKDTLPWEKAKKRCEEVNGYLVKIDNETENQWLTERARKKSGYYWIGLSFEVNYQWKWTNEKKKPSFLKFKKGYPTKKSDIPRCVYLYGHEYGYWTNYRCTSTKNYICETDKCV